MTIKHIIEYSALKSLFFFINLLHYRIALLALWPLAHFFHFILRFRTNTARQRIREVFPDLSKKEIHRIAWVSFRNIVFNAIETMRAKHLTAAWVDQHIETHNAYDEIKTYLKEGPVIFALLHMGNWDLAGQAIQLGNIPSFFIMRSQRNPLTTKLINAGRTAHGSEVLDRHDPNIIRKSLRMLKAGKTMAILLDLRAPTPALPLNFLGKPANIAGGLGLMAKLSGATILPVSVLRKGWSKHEILLLDPITFNRTADKNQEIARVTQQTLNTLSAQAIKHPDQYFWFNKRWVLEPLKNNES